MKVLLDECMNTKLVHRLAPEHEAHTVRGLGWHGRTDGAVLAALPTEGFGALITNDRGMPYQHNWALYSLRLLILRAPDNTYASHLQLVPLLKELLARPVSTGIYQLWLRRDGSTQEELWTPEMPRR